MVNSVQPFIGSRRKLLWVVVAVCVVGCGIVFSVMAMRGDSRRNQLGLPSSKDEASVNQGSSSESSSSQVLIGGVSRLESDVKLNEERPLESIGRSPTRTNGFSDPVPATANASAKRLLADLRDRENASSFSSFVSAKAFDFESFTASPDEYLDRVEPSRVFSTAQPGDGVSPIAANGSRYFTARQGESVSLKVSALPQSPVSFMSEGLGKFSNELSSITVRTNKDGVASADFVLSGGTVDNVRVLAGGPMNSGQVVFTVRVESTPRLRESNEN